MDKEIKKKLARNWFKILQDVICNEIETLESSPVKFISTSWNKNLLKEEGGGEYRILKNGKIFEKVGVNKSTVSGIFHKKFRNKILGANKNGKYWATGISVVAHMRNPKMPAIHFNTRFIVTSKSWFGGGMDVTPSFKDHNEKISIHKTLNLLCKNNNKSYQKLRSKLANDLNHMSKELSEALLIYLINYCLNEFKSGRSSVDELAFLYNLGLSKGILLHGGKLSDNRFLTIIEIVSKSKDYNSPDDFIQKWLD